MRLGEDNETKELEDENDSEESATPTRASVSLTRPKHYARSAVVSASMKKSLSHEPTWMIDSACSRTMTPSHVGLSGLVQNTTAISLADDSIIRATKSGIIALLVAGAPTVSALVVPHLHEPLLSVADVCDKNLTVVFTRKGCDIYRDGSINHKDGSVGSGYQEGNLYYLPQKVGSKSALFSLASKTDLSLLGYHRRLNHLGLKLLKKLVKQSLISPTVMNEIEVQQCETCVMAKMSRLPFKSRSPHCATRPGEMIHSDVASYEVQSREGYKYFVTFVDDCSKSVTVYPLKYKSDVFATFKLFKSAFEKTGKHTILGLTSDNGGEYIAKAFTSFLADHGIAHVLGPPHSPELNGVAERTNRTISNSVRCALISASLPKSFWADALRHTLHGFNSYPCVTPHGFVSPSSVPNSPPISFKNLHPFGCLAWYKIPEAGRKKLDPKAKSAILLSYLADGKGYRLWDLHSQAVVKSRDVLFDETRFPYGSPLIPSTEPVRVELPWPKTHPLASPDRTPTPDLPLLNIQLRPGVDRRLSASIHNPNARRP